MDIYYISIVDRQIKLHTHSGVMTGSLMAQLELLLSYYGYVKVDQSTLVKMDAAECFDPPTMQIKFKNGDSCTVSRSNKRKVSAYFDSKNGQ